MLDSKGLNGPPCGVPLRRGCTMPFSNMPLCKYRRIKRIEQIIEYLGRYVRRVAITNSRIEAVDQSGVTINYKKYAQQKKGKPAPIGTKVMKGEAFLQQFCQHILPFRFHRVRYYGIYGFAAKKIKTEIYTQLTNQPIEVYQPPSSKQIIEKMLGHHPNICSTCGVVNQMVSIPLLVDSSKLFVLTRKYATPQIRAGPVAKRLQISIGSVF